MAVSPSFTPDAVAALKAAIGQAPKRNRVSDALATAIEAIIRTSLSGELDKLVDAYRLMLRESLATGGDPALRGALNRARLQEKILAGTSMADQSEACELLGLSKGNPSATMKRKEQKGELLRFTVNGRAVYPLFQFDVEHRSVYPAMGRLIAMKPEGWSDFRLLHWLLRPHLDFGSAPAEHLADRADDVLAAFGREIEPTLHG